MGQEAPHCPKCDAKMHRRGTTPAGAVRWHCAAGGEYCYSTTNAEASVESRGKKQAKKPTRFVRALGTPTSARYLITAAQNATPVDPKFWASLKQASEKLGAELLVIPFRYKNPTSVFAQADADEEWWDKEVTPYLFNTRKKLNKNLVLLGDAKIQPTATSPLTGFEGFTGSESAIIGHARVQMKVIPVPAGKLPKILLTTGSCTKKNYTDTKTGQLGKFHHSAGAVMVEIKNSQIFFLREISADSEGVFTDLDKVFSPDGVTKAPPALSLALGDIHADVVDPKVVEATFDEHGICALLRPQYIFYHDLLDGISVNPHERGNIFLDIAKRMAKRNDVRGEVERACAFVEKNTPSYSTAVIVGSNHGDFLRRWVVNSDWRQDAEPKNAEFYLETALEMVRGTKMMKNGASYPTPFNQWAKKLIKNTKLRVLSDDESFMVGGVEFGLHGDRGPNGSRGSSKNISRIGVKTVIGHSHTPGIEGGCWQTGTSSYLRLGYNSGPSSWLNSHIVQYASGKRCIITIVDGEWRL